MQNKTKQPKISGRLVQISIACKCKDEKFFRNELSMLLVIPLFIKGINGLTFLAANSNFTYRVTKEAQPLAAQANNIDAFSFC